jgi:lipoprotein-anchoring transpeptidase ErfK/SrfK
MSTQPPNINERLRQGIEAARTGKEREARAHLIAVLKQDPQNIPAMLWLAFVLPSPQDTIRLLQRVLTLDPANERAKAGIRWARSRLGLPPEEPQPAASNSPLAPASATPTSNPEGLDDSIRSILLSEEVQEKAKKGAFAHRARRTINPFLGMIFIVLALGLAALGLGALVFGPPQTLAAWLPVTTANIPALPAQPAATLEKSMGPVEVLQPALAKSYTFGADTIILPKRPTRVAALAKPTPTPTVAVSSAPAQPEPIMVDPFKLVGPIGPLPFSGEAKVAEGKLQLAYQPSHPAEKWIEVNVTTQRVTAWEGDQAVMSFVASTGLPGTPTVLGQYHIYWKLESTLMTGYNYYLPEVPYTMYFYGGYALHGTYWHSNFGQPMSHGCVNLKTEEAKQLFDWAGPTIPAGQTQVEATADNPGTLVVVHE